MQHEPCETQRDSIHPVAFAYEDETHREIGFSRTRSLFGTLVAVALACTLANFGMRQRTITRQNLVDSKSTVAVRAGGVVPALVRSNFNEWGFRSLAAPSVPNLGSGETAEYAQDKPNSVPNSVEIIPQKTNKNKSQSSGIDTATSARNFQTQHSIPKTAHSSNNQRRQGAAQFDEFEAMVAIDKAAQQAGVCLGANDPRPVMRVAVTFATSGRAKKSEVETGPYQNAPQGECIARVLRSASVRPFDGSAITVHRAIQIR